MKQLTHPPQQWLNRDWLNWHCEVPTLTILDQLREFPELLRQCLMAKDHLVLSELSRKKWSILEHAGHLLAMESLWIARIDGFVLNQPILRAWNGDNRDVGLAKFNEQKSNAICRDFNQTRLALVDYVRELVESGTRYQAVEPQLDRMFTLHDHLAYMHEHDRHHLQTIQFLLQQNV